MHAYFYLDKVLRTTEANIYEKKKMRACIEFVNFLYSYNANEIEGKRMEISVLLLLLFVYCHLLS
jgi:hypothetical protein